VAGATAAGGGGGPAQRRDAGLEARHYREIRSARYPLGLPDRSDATVLDAFDGMWLLLDHSPRGVELVGLADDYEVARAWLDQGADRDHSVDNDADADQG
jgi:hypothetical protein